MSYLAGADYAINAYFLYAAFTSEGYIKVGISRVPFERIAAVHCGSPFPVEAAMWAWVGSQAGAREIERRLKKLWFDRSPRGEWFKFDYSDKEDKALFFVTINSVYESIVGKPAEWAKKSAEDVREMVRASINKRPTKSNVFQ